MAGYDEIIQAEATQQGLRYGVTVPVALVKAIIQVESGWNPSAVRQESGGRASYGLMQVLNTTAAQLGLSGDPAQLLQPSVGIHYGVQYLASQLARYVDSSTQLTDAVAAYNAGTAWTVQTDTGPQYSNQAYVDKVLLFLKVYGQPLAVSGGVLALLLGVFLWLRKKSRRRSST